MALWRSLPESNEVARDISNCKVMDPKVIKSHLGENNIFWIAERPLAENTLLYHSAKLEDVVLLIEFNIKNNNANNTITVSVKTSETFIVPKFFRIVESLLAPPV